MDTVEIPSHIFERCARDPTAMALLSSHAPAGPLPSSTLAAVLRHSTSFSALALQQQLLISFADHALHSAARELTTDDVHMVVQRIHDTHATLRLPQGCWPQVQYTHLATHAAVYYSYTYAKHVARRAWAHVFGEEPLKEEAGK